MLVSILVAAALAGAVQEKSLYPGDPPEYVTAKSQMADIMHTLPKGDKYRTLILTRFLAISEFKVLMVSGRHPLIAECKKLSGPFGEWIKDLEEYDKERAKHAAEQMSCDMEVVTMENESSHYAWKQRLNAWRER